MQKQDLQKTLLIIRIDYIKDEIRSQLLYAQSKFLKNFYPQQLSIFLSFHVIYSSVKL
jgi:hypothetical protein